MRQPLRQIAAAVLLGLAPAAALAAEAGELIFADRAPWTLNGRTLTWSLTREGPAIASFLPARDGAVTLAEAVDPADGKPMLRVTQRTDAGERPIGPFPVSAGDPIVVFFLESTARDMAALTGGSPDYIRNRIKDAVFRGGTVARDGKRVTAQMQPFADDPNKPRMGAFGGLTLRFVMDGDPHAPVREMLAETAEPVAVAPLAENPGQPIAPVRYRNAMVLR